MQAFVPYQQVLYSSQLAATQGYEIFTSICRVSRVRNAQLSCTGVLLFDGQRFCQLLQGPSPAIDTLMTHITRDKRHENLMTLFDGPIDARTTEPGWSSGFCEADELDVFEASGGLSGDAAMAAFRNILTRADLAP